jgi:N-methylhydantoinase B
MAMIDELLDYSERLTRSGLSAIPDGTYRGEYTVEQDGVDPDRVYPVTAEVTVAGSNLRVDFAGTAAQARGAINCTSSQSVGCVTYAVRCQLDPTIPMNEGFYRPIEMLFPEGSVVNCSYPAACNLRLGVGQAIIDAIIRALAPVSPDCAMAAAATVHTVNAQGMTEDGGMWGMLEVSMGAGGGRRGADGGDGLPFLMHGQGGWERNIEGYEWQYPIRIHRYALMPDTAGVGRWRGGVGLVKDMEFLSDALITLRATDRCERPPEGLDGGGPGKGGGWILNLGRPDERVLPNKVTNYPVKKGDMLTIRVSGGGGYGDPAERDPAAIARDIAEGLVSAPPSELAQVARADDEFLNVANDG